MSSSPLAPILVLSNLPDADNAHQLAQLIIARRLAACVNILAPCTSIYQWRGKTETASEVPVLIKTTQQCYPALQELIRDHHPYELPEIIQVSIDGGSDAYLQWLATTTMEPLL
jgi:periplasmic divalent cation tolerance protein